MRDRPFLGTKINPPNFSANDTPDTSQLLTNEPFINRTIPINSFLTFLGLIVLLKKKKQIQKKENKEEENKNNNKKKKKRTLTSHHRGVREIKA